MKKTKVALPASVRDAINLFFRIHHGRLGSNCFAFTFLFEVVVVVGMVESITLAHSLDDLAGTDYLMSAQAITEYRSVNKLPFY